MNEQDLKDCFAMFAMNGIIARGGLHPELMPEEAMARRAYEVADAMLEARKNQGENNEESDNGIAAVAPKRQRKR
jgi:hypothetical protein